jgi:hypothetical protein
VLLAPVALQLAVASSSRLFLQLGPNETDYLRGFRPGGWEGDRESETRFHWTTQTSSIQLPARVVGEGFVLRARVRRHLLEPAQITLHSEGTIVHSFSIVADTKIAYLILEVPLPRLGGRLPFELEIDSASADPRPLGIAIDWIALEGRGPGHVLPLPGLLALFGLLIACACAIPRAAGLSLRLSLAHAATIALIGIWGASADFIAFDRILRDGIVAYVFAGVVSLLLVIALRRSGVPAPTAGVLTMLVLVALALRLALLLHPHFFYPDVKSHGLVSYVLSKEGLRTFLERYAQTQFRFSLGLQFQSGHWYTFPYAPGLYVLGWPLISLLHMRPEVSVSVLAAVFNSVGLVVTFVLARHLLRSDQGGLIAAIAHIALPLYLVRLTMAYFPAVCGHVVDAAAFAFLALRLRRPLCRVECFILAALLTLSLLMYSQAIVNIGLLAALYLGVDFWMSRGAEDRRRQLALALTVTLALGGALALFYSRYVPIFAGMRHGVPMEEERILLEKQRVEREYAESRGESLPPGEEADPYSGPGFGPLRGLHRVAARLVIFYGPFALTILWGLGALMVQQAGTERRYLAAWASLFFAICFLAGALPAPNFLRYSKDLEASAPLFLAAFAWATLAIARRSRALAIVHVAAFVVMGLWRGIAMWRSTFEPMF